MICPTLSCVFGSVTYKVLECYVDIILSISSKPIMISDSETQLWTGGTWLRWWMKTMRKHPIDARPVEAMKSGVKSVGYYSFRSKKFNEWLKFWKSGMSRKWYELSNTTISQKNWVGDNDDTKLLISSPATKRAFVSFWYKSHFSLSIFTGLT